MRHNQHHNKSAHYNNTTQRAHHKAKHYQPKCHADGHKHEHIPHNHANHKGFHHNKMKCREHHQDGYKFHPSHHNKMKCKKIDITTRDNEGNTALHIALKNHNYKTAIKLIKHGADMNAQNNKGETALHIVSKQHHPHASKMATILIEHGADVNTPQLANCKAKEGTQGISNDQTEIAYNLDHTEHLLESNNQTDLVLNGQNSNLDLVADE